jgi:hypothetical protein
MRRKTEQDSNGNGTGHIKFRVIEIEVDGANDTLAEGIKALTLALSKGSTSNTATRALPPKRAAVAVSAVDTDDIVEEPEVEEETEDSQEEETDEAPAVTRPKRPAGPPPTPDVLSDIDLNSGKVSLKDYMAQKNPSDTFERYATIAVWYKENFNLDEVNDDRIYTAYRFIDLVPPNDVGQVLRNLKANKKWFDKGTTKGGYKINIVGLNKVHANFN